MKYLRLDLITFILRLFLHVDRKAAYMETSDGDLIDSTYFEGTLFYQAHMFKRDIYSFVIRCHLTIFVTKSTNLFIFVLSDKD